MAVTTVNGQPLRFFHLQRLDLAARGHGLEIRHRLTLADAGRRARLVEDYAVALACGRCRVVQETRPMPSASSPSGRRCGLGQLAYRKLGRPAVACGARSLRPPPSSSAAFAARLAGSWPRRWACDPTARSRVSGRGASRPRPWRTAVREFPAGLGRRSRCDRTFMARDALPRD